MGTEQIATLKKEIKDMQVQLKRGSEDRETQNKEFQKTVADQRATQNLLKAALAVLQEVYGKAAFAQEAAGQTPPAGFDTYKKNEQSGGVMGMLQQIIDDAKKVESEAISSEEDAQTAYESFVKESNASIEAKSKSIVDQSEAKAKAEDELIEAKKTLDGVNNELAALGNTKSDLHSSCDFVLKNFDLRQTARSEEIESLRNAKSILSGAK